MSTVKDGGMIMFATNERLRMLEKNALHHIESVDLATPMQQLHDVLEALIEVPTGQRRSDTEFARQASIALDILARHTQRLSAFVYTLTEHVEGCLCLQEK
jgi:hypothetical protein